MKHLFRDPVLARMAKSATLLDAKMMASTADFFGTPVISNTGITNAQVLSIYGELYSSAHWTALLGATSAATKLKRITITITNNALNLTSADAFFVLAVYTGATIPYAFDILPFGGMQGQSLSYVFDDNLYARGYRYARPGKILSATGVSLVCGQIGPGFSNGSVGNAAYISTLAATP